MPLPTFQQDPQPQSGHLLNIVKGIGQLLGKDKLRENPNAPASDWRTRKPDGTPSYKEDWWDAIYGNRGQAANKSIQMDTLGRQNALAEDAEMRSRNLADDTELRSRNISDIGARTTATTAAQNAAALSNIRAGREQENVTNAEGSEVAKGTLGNTLLGLRSTAQKIGTAMTQEELARQKAELDKSSFSPVQYTDMAGMKQSAELNKARTDKWGSSTAAINAQAVNDATQRGAGSISESALNTIRKGDEQGQAALAQARIQRELIESPEYPSLMAGSMKSSLLSPTADYEKSQSETEKNRAAAQSMIEGTEIERERALQPHVVPVQIGAPVIDPRTGEGFMTSPTGVRRFSTNRKPVAALTPEELQARKQGTDAGTSMQSNGKGGWR